MRKTLLTLALCLMTVTLFANTFGRDGGPITDQGTTTGGKGADGNFHILSVDNTGKVNVLATTTPGTVGQQTMAASAPVVIASDQSAVSVNVASGSAAGATLVSSAAYEASHVLKASAGTLMALTVYNSKVSAQFIQLFNSTTVPADTSVPVFTQTVAASSNYTFTLPVVGIPFTTGIAVSNSSTGPTKTIGSADIFITAVIK